jgi:hypothetical protein
MILNWAVPACPRSREEIIAASTASPDDLNFRHRSNSSISDGRCPIWNFIRQDMRPILSQFQPTFDLKQQRNQKRVVLYCMGADDPYITTASDRILSYPPPLRIPQRTLLSNVLQWYGWPPLCALQDPLCTHETDLANTFSSLLLAYSFLLPHQLSLARVAAFGVAFWAISATNLKTSTIRGRFFASRRTG